MRFRAPLSMFLATVAVACAAPSREVSSTTTISSAPVEARKCGPQTDRLEQLLVDPSLVEDVEPLYSHASSGKNGPTARLRGVTLRLSPACNLASVEVDRVLDCHSARRNSGVSLATDVANDPYGMPGVPVAIDVRADRDALVATLVVDDVDAAHTLLERARAFARSGALGASTCAKLAAAR